MNRVTYLETGSQDPHYNLAFEEYVLCNRTEGDYLMLWQNANAIIIGMNQNTEEEINRSFVEAHEIDVVRRSTGGGAVYHDLGNLNYSFITDIDDAEEIAMEKFTDPIVNALRKLGANAEAKGRNDILIDGKKISGTAQRIHGGRILYHGTLLFNANTEMVAGALKVDPEKFRSKSVKSVRTRIGNISDFISSDMDLTGFWKYLIEELGGTGMMRGVLNQDELNAIDQLVVQKYGTWTWNFGSSPKYDYKNRRYWDGGILDVTAAVHKGTVANVTFAGDFLAMKPLDEVCAALIGCQFRRDVFSEILDRYQLNEYFGSITKPEILDTFFS